MDTNVIAQNKLVKFNYNIIKEFVGGLSLLGTEVKSLKLQGCSLQGATIGFTNNQCFLLNSSIPPYKKCFANNHKSTRMRGILLNKNEIIKIKVACKMHNYQVMPLKIFINHKNLCKIQIAMGQRRKLVDKREYIKKRDNKKFQDILL